LPRDDVARILELVSTFRSLIFAGICAATASIALFGAADVEAQTECGSPGKPACPLQGWMRANVAAPLAADDAAALATGLEKAAKLSPDASWSSWVSIANAGAAAAKKNDIAGARASCKQCHDAWRDAYKSKYRTRPIPK